MSTEEKIQLPFHVSLSKTSVLKLTNGGLEIQLKITFERNVNPAEVKFNSLNSFTQSFMVMAYVLLRSFTERQ